MLRSLGGAGASFGGERSAESGERRGSGERGAARLAGTYEGWERLAPATGRGGGTPRTAGDRRRGAETKFSEIE